MTNSVLRPGQIHSRLSLPNGDKAILRGPEWNDLEGVIQYINSLVREHAQIGMTIPVTRESEAQWLGQRLAEIENGRTLMVVAEIDGQIVSVGDLQPLTGERNHTGYLGIGVVKSKRGTGLSKRMMLALLALARKMRLKIVILDVFATNTVAIRLYESVGFKEVGRVPKGIRREGKYIDLVRMTKELP